MFKISLLFKNFSNFTGKKLENFRIFNLRSVSTGLSSSTGSSQRRIQDPAKNL